MAYVASGIPLEGVVNHAQERGRAERLNGRRPDQAAERDVQSKADIVIIVIEERSFMRECIRAGLQITSHYSVVAFSSISEYILAKEETRSSVILLTCIGLSEDYCANALDQLRESEPSTAVVVLGPSKPDFLSVSVCHGAKGYIPFATKFEVVAEAIRVVLAGGTYAPMECLTSRVSYERESSSRKQEAKSNPLTPRETSVVRAIREGKSNKAIAYSLNMTENTVKVHVKHVFAKLKARNRTEVALMAEQSLLGIIDEQPLNQI
jgi:DNA-binding NarL/FixJ family response regulator